MTTPGFQSQQAAQQAASRATSAAASQAQSSYLTGEAGRRAAFVARSHQRGLGPLRLLGRLVGFIVTLAVITFVVGIFLTILGQVSPAWPHHLATWIQSHL
jgi:hypothetical protein